jgi:hypothetical protein
VGGRLVHLRSDGAESTFRIDPAGFRIGRDPGAELVLDSPRVSRQHARIEAEGGGHVLVDLGSPNGTSLNGHPVRGRERLEPGDLIGVAGEATLRYERAFELRRSAAALGVAALVLALAGGGVALWTLRQRALEREVIAPAVGLVEQGLALRETDAAAAKARFKSAVGVLYRHGLLDDVERGSVLDEGLLRIEAHLARPADLRSAYHELEDRTLQPVPSEGPPCELGRVEPAELTRCLETNIGWLLAELRQSGAEVPAAFVRQVGATLLAEHGFLGRTLVRGEPYVAMMRGELERKKMPPLLHYVAAIESGYRSEAKSHAGAVGLWQFMPRTAADYGLRVGGEGDERQDPEKATRAAAHYLQHLVFEFGSDALLLALAGYNYGQERVRGALKKLEDPFHDRSYWRLVERGLLPEETAAYVARFTAAALAGEAGLPKEETLRAAGYQSAALDPSLNER